jgi:hypothetical protein
MPANLTDDELTNMLASAERTGLDAHEWNAHSIRVLVAEVRRLRAALLDVRVNLRDDDPLAGFVDHALNGGR